MPDPKSTESDRGSAMYDLGSTTIFASRGDARFSYCLYVPPGFATAATPPELIVAMHGTGRSFLEYRNAFAEFGRWNNCLILAPLFPVGVRGDGNRDGFKYMAEADIRYDRALLSMVDEIGEKYGRRFERFALFGYSGGGHFAHRFLMLHPDRLWAASIGAPGSVTLLDPTRDWWVGIRDVEARFGIRIDPDAMAQVPVQMVVGGADLETWEITHREGGRNWMPGANDAGRTRPERLDSLRRSFEAAGVTVRFDLVAGMAHDGLRAVETVKDFFADILTAKRGQ
jgi:pimeloyl-ACP methyl ester carboxylesterase